MTVVQAKRMGFSELGKEGFVPHSVVDDDDEEEENDEEEEPQTDWGKSVKRQVSCKGRSVAVQVAGGLGLLLLLVLLGLPLTRGYE